MGERFDASGICKKSSGGSVRRVGRLRKLAVLVGVTVLANLVLGVALASAVAPTVTINPNPTASYTTAQVSGTVDPGDHETTVYIEYSKEPATEGWQFSFVQAIAAGSGPTPVAGELTGLEPGTQYSVRIGAENGVDPEAVSPGPDPTVTTKVVAPPTVLIDPVATSSATTAHFSGHIDPEAPEAAPTSPAVEEAFKTRWSFECTPECPGLEGVLPADNSSDEVSANASGLHPGTSYEVRLVASNAGGTGTAGPESFMTEPAAPSIASAAVTNVGSTGADLTAQINPNGAATSYRFEFGPEDCSAGACVSVPATAQTIGTGAALVNVTQHVGGLAPGATYHFRVVATNAVDSTEGSDRSFSTLALAEPALPDGRVYEQVSPVDKQFNDVAFGQGYVQSSESGDAVAFWSGGGFDGALSSPANAAYLALRGPTAWTTQGLSAPQNSRAADFAKVYGSDNDLSQSVVTATAVLAPGASPEYGNLYLQNNRLHTYQLIAAGTPAFDSGLFGTVAGSWGTADYSHIAIQAPASWTPEAPGSFTQNLYDFTGGQLHLVGVLPDGTPAGGSAMGGANYFLQKHSISTESDPVSGAQAGSRIYFTSPTDGSAPAQLYLRENDAKTILVSRPDPGVVDPRGTQNATFGTASLDGSRVFFFSSEKLTAGATAGGPEGEPTTEGADLYELDVDTNQLKDLTTVNPAGGGVVGVLGASSNGDYVYFSSYNVLAAGGIAQAPNVYVTHGGAIRFVGLGPEGSPGSLTLEYGIRESRVSPSGVFAEFPSREPRPSYDNEGPCGANQTVVLCSEFYIYNYDQNHLSCASCIPSGQAPTRDAFLSTEQIGGSFPDRFVVPRALTDDGDFFFNSGDALVPQDTNGLTDVYEWEGGRVHLISSGTASTRSYLGDSTANGSDVFFVTRDRLVGQDDDSNYDVYDARVDGGLAGQNPPPPPIDCVGDSCRGPASSPSAVQVPGSSTIVNGKKPQKKHHRPRRHRKKHVRKGHGSHKRHKASRAKTGAGR